MLWPVEELERRKGGEQKRGAEKEKGKGKRRRKEKGKKVRPSKQNQMQECGGLFDLDPHRLIDVAHFISLSKS